MITSLTSYPMYSNLTGEIWAEGLYKWCSVNISIRSFIGWQQGISQRPGGLSSGSGSLQTKASVPYRGRILFALPRPSSLSVRVTCECWPHIMIAYIERPLRHTTFVDVIFHPIHRSRYSQKTLISMSEIPLGHLLCIVYLLLELFDPRIRNKKLYGCYAVRAASGNSFLRRPMNS